MTIRSFFPFVLALLLLMLPWTGSTDEAAPVEVTLVPAQNTEDDSMGGCLVCVQTIQCKQPSGETFLATQLGDSSFFFFETQDGYQVKQGADHWFYYLEVRENPQRGRYEIALSDARYLIDEPPAAPATCEALDKYPSLGIAAELTSNHTP